MLHTLLLITLQIRMFCTFGITGEVFNNFPVLHLSNFYIYTRFS